MEKKIYAKPEIETLKMEGCQLLAGSEEPTIESSKKNDIQADADGYYWAE